jgi:hypothetical protein
MLQNHRKVKNKTFPLQKCSNADPKEYKANILKRICINLRA